MAELWFPVPPLADDVVLLRPWREADVPGKLLAFSDPVMQRFSWRTTPYTETDARDDFAEQEEARLRGEELNFALVEPHEQDVVLGDVSLYEVRLDQGCAAVWVLARPRGPRPGCRDTCGPPAGPVGIRQAGTGPTGADLQSRQ